MLGECARAGSPLKRMSAAGRAGVCGGWAGGRGGEPADPPRGCVRARRAENRITSRVRRAVTGRITSRVRRPVKSRITSRVRRAGWEPYHLEGASGGWEPHRLRVRRAGWEPCHLEGASGGVGAVSPGGRVGRSRAVSPQGCVGRGVEIEGARGRGRTSGTPRDGWTATAGSPGGGGCCSALLGAARGDTTVSGAPTLDQPASTNAATAGSVQAALMAARAPAGTTAIGLPGCGAAAQRVQAPPPVRGEHTPNRWISEHG